MARENCGLLAVPRTVPDQLTAQLGRYITHSVNGPHSEFSYVVGLYQNAESAKDKPVLRYGWLFISHVKCLEP